MAIVGAMLLARKDKPEEIDRMEQALIDAQAEQSSPADKAETSKEEVAA
jgi:hypothetical protein